MCNFCNVSTNFKKFKNFSFCFDLTQNKSQRLTLARNLSKNSSLFTQPDRYSFATAALVRIKMHSKPVFHGNAKSFALWVPEMERIKKESENEAHKNLILLIFQTVWKNPIYPNSLFSCNRFLLMKIEISHKRHLSSFICQKFVIYSKLPWIFLKITYSLVRSY